MGGFGDVVRVARMLCLLALLCLPLDAAQAQARKRVALLIGNAGYASATTLGNPHNDVRLVAESAKQAGFQTVTIRHDLGMAQFQQALREFRALADGAEVAMVYYAGHGMEGNGRNWLIPTDAGLASDRDLPYEAINLDQVMEAIEGATLRMVVLDACRNNPFGRGWRGGTRALSRGLGGVEADDVLVIYAAAPGQVAADGEAGNSPFAKALAVRLAEPGLPVQMLGGAVRDDVLAATGGSQRPFVSASITGKAYYLVQAGTGGATAGMAPAPVPVLDAQALDLATWQGAIAANSAAAFEDYLRSHPQGRFRVQAEQNLARVSASIDATPAVAPLDALRKLAIGRWRTQDGRGLGLGLTSNCKRYWEVVSIDERSASFRYYDNPTSTGQPSAFVVIKLHADRMTLKTKMNPIVRTWSLSVSGDEMRLEPGGCEYFRAPVGGPEPPIVR
ncbi:MAG: caspase family protein [Thermomonas sp.]